MADDWSLDEARSIVARVTAEQRAEERAAAEQWLEELRAMPLERQAASVAEWIAQHRWRDGALDYAQTRLGEVQAELEALALRYENGAADFAGIGDEAMAQTLTAAAKHIRAVARG